MPSKHTLHSKEYVRPTQSSTNRQLPRHSNSMSQVTLRDEELDDRQSNVRQGRGLSEATAMKEQRQQNRENTLLQIGDVLDSLNSSTKRIAKVEKASASSQNVKDTIQNMKTFAKPYHGVKSLMNLVDEVEEEFKL